MRGRACAVLAVCAWGTASCSRTELDVFGAASGAAGAAQAQGGATGASGASGGTQVMNGADAAPCAWTFAPQVTFPAGGYPVGLAIADFTGDGVPDILTLNGIGNDIALWRNLGGGAFAPRVTIPVGSTPYGMAVGDFSGDGTLDLAIIYEFQADGVSHELDILLGRGNGRFAPVVSYPINGGAFSIAAGDFNADGQLDLALLDAKTNVSVLTNQGQGTFAPVITYENASFTDQVSVADFNQDGLPDLATAGVAMNVLLNQGAGSFAAPVGYPNAADCAGPMIAADLTGDGYPELVRSCYQLGSYVVMRTNTGDGTLGPEAQYMTGQWPWGLVVGDFTGDGRKDLAAANSWAYANSVSVLPDMAGTLGSPITYAATSANFIAAGDLNQDGHDDLVTAGADTLAVLLSRCE